jgi:hypothetical protein
MKKSQRDKQTLVIPMESTGTRSSGQEQSRSGEHLEKTDEVQSKSHTKGDPIMQINAVGSGEGDSAEKMSEMTMGNGGLAARNGFGHIDSFAMRFQNMKRNIFDENIIFPQQGFNAIDNDFVDSLFGNNMSLGNKPVKTFSRLGSLGDEGNQVYGDQPIQQSSPFSSKDAYLRQRSFPTKEDSVTKAWMEPKPVETINQVCGQPDGQFECFGLIDIGGHTLKKLKYLYEMLVKIFCNGVVNIFDYELSPLDESIMNSLLMRKFFKKLTKTQLEMNKMDKVEILNQIILTRSSKRPEEFYKFVLTRVIKTLKKRFKEDTKCSGDLELEFYQYYFKNTAAEMNIDIEKFYYPLTGKASKKKPDGGKVNMNLNTGYYQRIFNSPNFIQDMNICLEGMTDDYAKEIEKKFESLFAKWDSELESEGLNVKAFEAKVSAYLEKNKRCKLPWTINEVREAIERFTLLVESIGPDSRQ